MEQTTAIAPQQDNTQIVPGFGNASAFDLIQRQAKLLAASALVPKEFQGNIANCVIALEMASRIGASPLMICQNLYIVHGKPGWSSQFIIAAINASGKFSPLRFEIAGEGDKRTCVAWAIEKGTDQRLESPPVSIEMAKKEGWSTKNGSKWQTMPELMLRYRTATFFGRLYAPEILMGMRTEDELKDVIEINPIVDAASAADVMKRFDDQAVTDAVIPDDDGWPDPPNAEIPMTDEERAKIEAEEQSLFGERSPGEEG